ncbi:hypothetical protein FHS22_007031 [Planomonospora venezuelensis]|uniref:Uncharacterized protein n=1 Tax=Planomonospora venezuelensis TaxID=1999 RepID=A0A841DHD4_PLAVE|nr:hypothetical protein [Planomonospora venezuelensis]
MTGSIPGSIKDAAVLGPGTQAAKREGVRSELKRLTAR